MLKHVGLTGRYGARAYTYRLFILQGFKYDISISAANSDESSVSASGIISSACVNIF